MHSIVSAVSVYAVVWLLFRISGKKALSQMTSFDFVLLLIISETTQAALVENDNSMTNTFLLIATFFAVEMGLSVLKTWSPRLADVVEGRPVLVYAEGRLVDEVARHEHVDEEDILEAARLRQGLERLDQVKYAVLERSGDITVIPRADPRKG